MSKRAEEAAWKWATENNVDPFSMGQAYGIGYEQAEKDTIERALDWLMAHTKSYAGPIEDPFWTMFIEHFKKAMEEE